MNGKQWAVSLTGLALLLGFNGYVMAPLFGLDTGGKIGTFLWSVMTGLAWGIYGTRYIRRNV